MRFFALLFSAIGARYPQPHPPPQHAPPETGPTGEGPAPAPTATEAAKTDKTRLAPSPHPGQADSLAADIGCRRSKREPQASQAYS